MNDLKMTLTGGEEVAISSFGVPLHIVADCPTREAATSAWEKLTPENLEDLKITDNGDVIAEFVNVKLVSAQFVSNENGSVTAHFYMDGENRSAAADNEYVIAAKILLGEEV